MVEEIWKDIEGYEGLYQVSDMGRVKSFPRPGTRTMKPRILKLSIEKKGYVKLNLRKNNRVKTVRIHRLVALSFLLNPENKRVVNHVDSDRSNNMLENLEWATQSENIIHGYQHGNIEYKNGSMGNGAKLTETDIPAIRSWLSKGWTQKRVAVLFRISESGIGKISRGEIWNHV